MVVRALTIVASVFLFVALPSPATAQTDADGDGHASVASGGDDCDDSDASRFPGNAEFADRRDHDEDCDPTTFGSVDEDGDGFVASWACNADPSGGLNCGRDCNDGDPAIHPNQIDICNARDDNCDGDRDEDQPCDMLEEFRERMEAEREERARAERQRAVEERAAEALGDADRPNVDPRPSGGQKIQLPGAAAGDQNTCRDAVQGKIAWNYEGTTRWAEGNIERLCAGAGDSVAPARCFDDVMHGGVDRGDGSTRWTWQSASNLCAGTRDARATIDCFESAVSGGRSQAQAIKECAAG